MKTKIYPSILIIFILLAISSISFAQWTQLVDMPTARNAHAVGIVNGKIYAVGGEQLNSKLLEEYNPITDTWVRKTDMPTRRGWLSCSVVNEKIYAIGGYNPATLDKIEEYDPATDTWTTKSPMPTVRWGPGTGTVNGKIYVFGGYNNEGTASAVEEYDPAVDTWTTKTPMPTARWGLTTGTVNGKIYAIGGGNVYKPTKALNIVEEYDPVSDTWKIKAPMPVGRIALAPSSVTIDGKIYVIGGGGLKASDAYAEVFVYDPEDETSLINGTFEFEGRTRNYMVSLPNNYPDNIKLSLVIYLHSYGWTAQQGMDYTKLNQVADSSNFIIVYPSAIPNWNSGIGNNSSWQTPNVDDVGFIDALIDTLSNNYSIDLERVYACGYSNGGFMSYKLACQLSHRIAAIASVGGVVSANTAANCNPLRTMPVLQIHGTNDPWVPINGTTNWNSVDQTLSYWTNFNNCVEADTTILPDLDETDGCFVKKNSYTNCSNNSNVIFYKVINGGHTWPSAEPPGYSAGNTNQDINASTLILNFFKEHKLVTSIE